MEPTLNILLVEDDEVDAEAVMRAFRNQKIANPVKWVRDGIEALQVLRSEDSIKQPFLILLDLNMPRMDGFEFLQEIRNDKKLGSHIVFVLTTSDAFSDRLTAYENNISGYLLKSKVGEEFVNLVNLVDCYWRYVEFPPGEDH